MFTDAAFVYKTVLSLAENGIISTDDVPYMMNMHVQEIIDKYQHWMPKAPRADGYWYIYVPDRTSKGGRRRLKSKSYADLIRKIETFEAGHYGRVTKTFEEMYYLIQDQRLDGITDSEKQAARTSTVVRQNQTYNRFFAGTAFVSLRIDAIKPNDIDSFLQMNLKRYRVIKSAFNAMVQILKKVFDKAYRREMIDYNPCDRIEWDSDEYSNKFITSAGIKERTYTEREMDLLWDHEQSVIAKRPSFLTPYAMLLQMQLGLRRGEVCALHWDDITTDENGTRYLTIQRMLRKVPKHNGMPEHQVISQHTKTSKDRTIPLWKEVTDLLDAVYEISGDGTYIFPGEAADGCLGINSIYKHYTRACAAIGIPIQKDVIRGPHAWRRNFAKRLGNSYLSSHLLGNDQKVCEENYSNAIDFAEALAELEKKGLKKGLKIGLKMDQTLKKEA